MNVEMPVVERAILFCLRNEDYRWDSAAQLEDLDDGAGLTFIGITEKYDGPTLQREHGLTMRELYELYKQDKAKAVGIIIDIYQRKYWDNRGFDRIKSDRIAIRLFDLAVNNGFGGLNNIMARAGLGKTFNADTVNALIENEGELAALHQIKSAALDRYKDLKGWSRFSKGWSNRLNKDEFQI